MGLQKQVRRWSWTAGSLQLTCRTAAPLLVSRAGPSPSARLLRPCKGASPIFTPYIPSNADDDDEDEKLALYEIVVALDAPDAPPLALCNHRDGFWHTGDLFEKACPAEGGPEGWIYRGRAGDWIKTCSGFVDTKFALLFLSTSHHPLTRNVSVDLSKTLFAGNAPLRFSTPLLSGRRENTRCSLWRHRSPQ